MALKDTYPSALDLLTLSIGAGQTLSAGVNLSGLRVFGIVMPAAWTAAGLTFQMSPDGGATWVDMRDQDGAEITVAATAGAYGALSSPAQFAPIQYLRVRSGTAAAPVAQAADRALSLVLRGI